MVAGAKMVLSMLNNFRRKALEKVFGWPPQAHDPPRETAWLDGVRGLAAFFVLMNHYSLEWLSVFSDAPFGARVLSNENPDQIWYHYEGERLWDPWRLPLLRIIMCSGNAQVAVFFVLSGFVLSWGPLASLRANRFEKASLALGSSTVRRWFRLYTPCFVVTLAYLLHRIITFDHEASSVFGEIWNFLRGSERWANPFETTHIQQFTASHPYAYVMWTIPFEFGGSMFVYVAMLGLGRIRDYRRRTAAIVFVSLYALVSLYWGYWLFGSGLALADYVHEAGGFKKLSQRTSTRACCAWLAAFILGLLLMGWMATHRWYTRPGYEWMDHIPLPPGYRPLGDEGRFWWGWGGILVIASSCHLSFIRKFFEFRIIQHLGRISFMLYLIHILIHEIVTKPLRPYLYSVFCTKEFSETYLGDVFISTPFKNIAIYCTLWVISVFIVMCVAHFLEVYVDKPCTSFGKWVDDKLVNGFGDIKMATEEEEQLLDSTHVADVEMNEMVQR